MSDKLHSHQSGKPNGKSGRFEKLEAGLVPPRLVPQPGAATGTGMGRPDEEMPASTRRALYDYVKKQLAGPELHDEHIQYELGRWLHLLEAGESDVNKGPLEADEVLARLVRKAGAAIPALLSARPELVFARTLRVQAEITLLRHNGWFTRNLIWLTGGSPVLTVCLGSLAALLVGLALAVIWLQGFEGAGAAMPLDGLVPTAAAAAYLGGLVSVMSRLHRFARLGDFEHVFLFSNALARPLMGAIFGVFAYAATRSGLVPLDKELIQSITSYQVWTIGFVAGFSERLAKDLVSRGEAMLVKKA